MKKLNKQNISKIEFIKTIIPTLDPVDFPLQEMLEIYNNGGDILISEILFEQRQVLKRKIETVRNAK